MRSKYSEDFGEYVKEIANDENAEGTDLLYCLKQLEHVGIAIKDGELNEGDVNLVCEHHGITNEVLMKIVDKFLIIISNEMEKN
jgi:hypothetical protein